MSTLTWGFALIPHLTALQPSGRTLVLRQVVPVLPSYTKFLSGSLCDPALDTLFSLTHTHTHTHTHTCTHTSVAQQEAFSSQWQKLTKGSVSDLCGGAPAGHGYLTWRYASHYVTASQWPLLVAMNYWSTVTFGTSEQLRALNHRGQRWQLLSDCQGLLYQWLVDFKKARTSQSLHICLMHGDR